MPKVDRRRLRHFLFACERALALLADRCHAVGWVSLRSDDAVQIGLQATTWGSDPQVAQVRVRKRIGSGGVYDDLPWATVNVGSTGALGTIDGVTYVIRVSSIDECVVHYVASTSQR